MAAPHVAGIVALYLLRRAHRWREQLLTRLADAGVTDTDLADDDNLVGDWQQDRWSNGGSSGNLSAYSLDGGASWAISTWCWSLGS